MANERARSAPPLTFDPGRSRTVSPMGTYMIGEVAARSGFSASALRYYEGTGLVAPVARNAAGYRVYDDQTLARLAFIARAKQLGCTLDEIADLVGIWDGAQCGPVQRRLQTLVADKIDTVERRVAESTTFAGQLRRAAAQLDGEPIDGPCRDDCSCITGPSPTATTVESVTAAASVDPEIACTLDRGEMTDRLADWRKILDQARSRTTAADGARRVEFDDGIDLDELVGIVAAEQRCCAFFSFTITVDARGIALEVRAPEHASELVSALFGPRV